MNEFDIVQNNLLGAIAINSFSKEYYISKEKIKGVPLPLIFAVLPIVFNEDSSNKINLNQKRITSFFKTLAEDKLIPIGLQKKMEQMFDQTIKSLSISFSLRLIKYDPINSEIIPSIGIQLPRLNYSDNIKIAHTSGILGYWFGKLTFEEICVALKIEF
jgi:hypothetical protein